MQMQIIIDRILRDEKSNSLTKNQKITIFMLASFMGNQCFCFPSIKELSRVTSLSKNTCLRTIDELERLNILYIQRNHRKSNIYTFEDSWVSQ
jgi:hypothetical protein